MKCVKMLALVLVIVGAINWGLWGFFQFDLVAWVAGGNTSSLARIIYGLVGLAGIYSLRALSRCSSCKCGCGKGKGGSCSR